MAPSSSMDEDHGATAHSSQHQSLQALALTLSQAAAAFRDADFFESAILYWSVALACTPAEALEDPFDEEILEFGMDLEQELGLDVQQHDPIELVYPPTIRRVVAAQQNYLRQKINGSEDQEKDVHGHQQRHTIPLGQSTTPPLFVYILTALAYLSRQINIRIDILPSGNDTLTTLGPPQRYYGALSPVQRSLYHDLLAIVLATSLHTSISSENHHHHHSSPQHDNHFTTPSWEQSDPLSPTLLLGNEVTASWQIMIPQKRTPHSMPRFFSYLNPCTATVAGCSIPRNELDLAALAESGVRLVVTLIKESPLPQKWFSVSPLAQVRPVTAAATTQGQQQTSGEASLDQQGSGGDEDEDEDVPLPVRNAFVPIENLKAPAFPEVFETILGWCVRTTASSLSSPHNSGNNSDGAALRPRYDHTHPHQNAILIHCGGGKGRAGVMLAAHLMRFGLSGHGNAGYCRKCIADKNLHSYDLSVFHQRRGGEGQSSSSSTLQQQQHDISNALPTPCSSHEEDQDEEESDDDDSEEEEGDGEKYPFGLDITTGVYVVKARHCVNRYRPVMTARDAMAYLRTIRPGSIETVVQEKALKAYGDWLWRQASKQRRSDDAKHEMEDTATEHSNGSATGPDHSDGIDDKSTSGKGGAKGKGKGKGKDKSNGPSTPAPKQSKPKRQTGTTPATKAEQSVDEDESEEEGRGRGKRGKHKHKQQQQEEHKFVPPPANKIIKLPSGGKGSHHQHHLIVQHNMRARQLQRGQKKNKGDSANQHGKGRKGDCPVTSFRVVGAPLEKPTLPPKLIVLTGLPGSGKSHLVARLLAQFPEHFVRISQDELGSRPVCERLVAQSMRHQQQSAAAKGNHALALPMSVVVDRCNPTYADRKSWYETAFQPDETCMIWFSAAQATCVERAQARENHPTLEPSNAHRVIKGFAKEFETPNLAKESWCKTLVEVGDFEGADQAFELLAAMAATVPGSAPKKPLSASSASTTRAPRPAFIPAKVLQRRQQTSDTADSSASAGMDRAAEKKEDDGEDYEEEGKEAENDNDDNNNGKEEEEDATVKKTKDDDGSDAGPGHEQQAVDTPLAKALQFASPTGHRPAVKKPARGSYHGNQLVTSKQTTNGGHDSIDADVSGTKGVKFASPISSYARPMQKFPRTPHLFDPLTVQSPSCSNSDQEKKSPAISRNDLLLPPSALDQVFCPKANQVLTVEEKLDGANLGFSVLHFKSMSGTASTAVQPPPKIRVQNRSHFINSEDHWQFKKLDQWLDKYREDVLWLCEGRWRYETRDGKKLQNGLSSEEAVEQQQSQDGDEEEEINVDSEKSLLEDDGDDAWQDTGSEKGDENDGDEEYVDEDRVLQDGLAAYVLYGEWLYAKHSVQYTGLDSWFVPFDLLDVKTGMFVSRKVFSKAIGQTKLRGPPQISIPEDVRGDKTKMVEWVMQKLESTSQLVRQDEGEGKGKKERRVEGLYFRIDQGHRLLTRCKVVRPDFIASEERWGTKEQVTNDLKWDAYL
ncbi:hypothetical protein BGW42_006836 [Actinomortierella wolfii]|nr:hypothetical protein BGW42_006836 [Actinomortierella wolfii]